MNTDDERFLCQTLVHSYFWAVIIGFSLWHLYDCLQLQKRYERLKNKIRVEWYKLKCLVWDLKHNPKKN